jgi:hypothetical protein
VIDADEIHPGLWQGSLPPRGTTLANLGFKAVALCAVEWQFPANAFWGVSVLHAPNRDDGSPLTRDQLNIAIETAKKLSRRIQDGQKVLSTCYHGINRSGLVSALTLHFLNGWSGAHCIEVVREKRKIPDHRMALSNKDFTQALSNLPGTDPVKEEPLIVLATR